MHYIFVCFCYVVIVLLGRKYHARRLSNSSLANGGRSPSALSALDGADDDEEGTEEVQLRFYSKCKYPMSCGQALEELEFFKVLAY